MPPREATGAFADQLIAYDYHGDVAALQQQQQAPVPLEPPPPIVPPTPTAVSNTSATELIDPLSIDPTVDDNDNDNINDQQSLGSSPLSTGSSLLPTPPQSPSFATPRLVSMDLDDSDDDDNDNNNSSDDEQGLRRTPAFEEDAQSPHNPPPICLRFGPQTTLTDLKYFAERGCIVPTLQALDSPRLLTLGTRMLADYAKLTHRRVAVAGNKRIVEFLLEQCQSSNNNNNSNNTATQEYAVETIRSLTATEESDAHLMPTLNLLPTLAHVALHATHKTRLHACIAIMNLSCGKANKILICACPAVLHAMRHVMVQIDCPEASLKATTCIKNLSNADANDNALLETTGLLQALAHVARTAPTAAAVTNACLAIMNLSIAKTNKHLVFLTPGIMDALLYVLQESQYSEARVKACSALSNLAIGYDNKIPMFCYPHFCETILRVILTDTGEARTKASSILWSFAAERQNQIPVVQRGDVVPVLVQVATEDSSEARFKCVAALTLLAESLENAESLLQAVVPLGEILHQAGPDPTAWKGQTASWCVGFFMNLSQAPAAVPALRRAGVVELLRPLLPLDHYQSLKAAMAVTFCCAMHETASYELLRQTECVLPKIVSLLHNTLQGKGGNGYKYGVFTLRSSVGCMAALAAGPDFLRESIATQPVLESLATVLHDYCVDGGTPGAIVGGGRDDERSAVLAVRAVYLLVQHLIPTVGSSALPFVSLEDSLVRALRAVCAHEPVPEETRAQAADALERIVAGKQTRKFACYDTETTTSSCCVLEIGETMLAALTSSYDPKALISSPSIVEATENDTDSDNTPPIRTFLLSDATGRRFVVPRDPSGGRSFHDRRIWCYRRGRFCVAGEAPDPTYVWTTELQQAYEAALQGDVVAAMRLD